MVAWRYPEAADLPTHGQADPVVPRHGLRRSADARSSRALRRHRRPDRVAQAVHASAVPLARSREARDHRQRCGRSAVRAQSKGGKLPARTAPSSVHVVARPRTRFRARKASGRRSSRRCPTPSCTSTTASTTGRQSPTGPSRPTSQRVRICCSRRPRTLCSTAASTRTSSRRICSRRRSGSIPPRCPRWRRGTATTGTRPTASLRRGPDGRGNSGHDGPCGPCRDGWRQGLSCAEYDGRRQREGRSVRGGSNRTAAGRRKGVVQSCEPRCERRFRRVGWDDIAVTLGQLSCNP
jgi:hypothetical protein